jgi:hypothetical protein
MPLSTVRYPAWRHALHVKAERLSLCLAPEILVALILKVLRNHFLLFASAAKRVAPLHDTRTSWNVTVTRGKRTDRPSDVPSYTRFWRINSCQAKGSTLQPLAHNQPRISRSPRPHSFNEQLASLESLPLFMSSRWMTQRRTLRRSKAER